MRKNMIFEFKIYGIFAIISALYFNFLFWDARPIAFGDISIIYRPEQLFRAYQFPWDSLTNFGKPNILLGNAIYNSLIYALYLVVREVPLAHKILLVLIFSLSGYCTYVFLRTLTGARDKWLLMISLMNMFNIFLLQKLLAGHNTILLGYPFFLLALTALIKASPNIKSIVALFTSIFVLSAVNPHLSYIFAIASIIYSVLILFTKNNKQIQRLFISLLLVSMLFISSLPFILHELFIKSESYVMRAEEIGAYDVFIAEFNSNALLAMGFVSFLVFEALTVFVYLIYLRSRMPKNNRCTLYDNYFTLIFIIGLVLFLLSLQPFKPLYALLFKYIPFFWIFRDAGKFLMLSVTSSGYMLYMGIINLPNKAKSSHIKISDKKGNLLKILLIIFFLIYLIPTWFYIIKNVQFLSMPDYYDKLYNKLYSEKGQYKIAYIPPATWASNYSWARRYFLDFTISQQPKQTLGLPTEAELTLSDQFLRWLLAKMCYEPDNNWEPLLRYIGIKYIILRYDMNLPQNRDDFKVFNPLLIKSCHSIISNLLNKKDVIGNVTLLEIQNPAPYLVFSKKMAYIVGDRDALIALSNLNFSFENIFTLFPDNLGANKIDVSPDYIILQDISPQAFIASFSRGYLVKPSLYANYSIDASIQWIYGDLGWYIYPGELSSAPEKYALTTGLNRMRIYFNIDQGGTYRLLIKALSGNNTFIGKIRISLDNSSEVINLKSNTLDTSYKWIDTGLWNLASGYHEMIVDNLGGLSSISLIKLVPVGYEEQSLEESWGNANIIVVIDKSSLKISKDSKYNYQTRFFIPKSYNYSLIIAIEDTKIKDSYQFQFKIDNSSYTVTLNNIAGNKRIKLYSMSESINLGKGEHDLKILGNISSIKAVALTTDPTVFYNLANGTLLSSPVPSSEKENKALDNRTIFATFTVAYNNGWILRLGNSEQEPVIAMSAFNGYILRNIDNASQGSVLYRGTSYILIGIYIQVILLLLLMILNVILEKTKEKV